MKLKDIDLERGLMRFERPKVNKVQLHRLTKTALEAIKNFIDRVIHNKWFPIETEFLILPTDAGAHLHSTTRPISTVSIGRRVRVIGEAIGIQNLSLHDCRHYWATQAARHGTRLENLRDAGGWASLNMPSRYIESAKIANDGVMLG